ncbi:hypothetical protein ACMFMF_006269 [Clarireedia jacksonii]
MLAPPSNSTTTPINTTSHQLIYNKPTSCPQFHMPKTQPSISPSHDVQTYIRYLHIACTHEYHDDGTDIREKQLQLLTSPRFYTESTFDTFFIMTPRWCPQCRVERACMIRESYRGRVAEGNSVAVDPEEDGYVCGIS